MARDDGTTQRRQPPRRDRGQMSTLAAGAIATVVIALIVFFGFTKHVPFTHGFRVKAVFTSATSIRKNSPVRIAGVNVGKVKSTERFGNTNMSTITMELQDNGLPVHKDATLKIRPRIFLEGNFFVDLRPGTPAQPTVHDGDTIPVTQTSTPVQLDEVLTALQSDTRADLQNLLVEYGKAVDEKPALGADAGQDPEVRGLTGAQALNKSLRYAPPALRGTAAVNRALLGTQPHDLSKLIASTGKVTRALDSRESSLQDLVTNLNTTMRATAAESTSLRATIRLLAPTLGTTRRALRAVDGALPPTRAFARDILPGTRETAATIAAAFPWIEQTKALLGPAELQGLARETRPTVRDASRLIDGVVRLNPQLDLVNRCVKDVILPAGDVKIRNEGLLGYKPVENYKEFWYTMVGLTGEGQNFDGNGQYVRFQAGGGSQTLSLGQASLSGDKLFANPATGQSGAGNAPAYPQKRPPKMPDVPCYTQPIPDYNGPASFGANASTPVGAANPLLPGLQLPGIDDLFGLLGLPNPLAGLPNPLAGILPGSQQK